MQITIGPSPSTTDHLTFVARITELVGRHGAGQTLEHLDGVVVPSIGRPHRTLTAFVVWAVDHLLRSGLEPWQVVWHPLVAPGAALAWYDRAALASPDAHERFVAPPDHGDAAPRPILPLAVAS